MRARGSRVKSRFFIADLLSSDRGRMPAATAENLDPPGRTPCDLGDPNRSGGVEQLLQPEFSITLGCVSSGEQTGCFLDIDGLHEYPFLPIG